MTPRELSALVEILRSTLYLIDYYGAGVSDLEALGEARKSIRKAIDELESAIAAQSAD
jgi:hypothetical protein